MTYLTNALIAGIVMLINGIITYFLFDLAGLLPQKGKRAID